MSIKIMSIVWDADGLDAAEKIVLLSLADHADDTGKCYPSTARLCRKTSLTERGVQGVVSRLKAKGWLSITIGGGKSGSNLYTITPAPYAPPHPPPPRTMRTPPPHPVPQTPAPGAPKPSVTINETKKRETNVSRARDETAVCIAHFNAIAERVGWSQVQKITGPRKASLAHRIADCGGADAWCGAMDRAASSPLLTGQSGRGWRADFDWLCKPANFTKLMEGNYDPRTDHCGNGAYQRGSGGPHDSMVAAFAFVAGRESH